MRLAPVNPTLLVPTARPTGSKAAVHPRTVHLQTVRLAGLAPSPPMAVPSATSRLPPIPSAPTPTSPTPQRPVAGALAAVPHSILPSPLAPSSALPSSARSATRIPFPSDRTRRADSTASATICVRRTSTISEPLARSSSPPVLISSSSVIPSEDSHGSEYIAPHDKRREWISGFVDYLDSTPLFR